MNLNISVYCHLQHLLILVVQLNEHCNSCLFVRFFIAIIFYVFTYYFYDIKPLNIMKEM